MIGVNRRRVMGSGGSAPLPYDAEIEYLESTGTQYIDLGITMSKDFSMTLVFESTSSKDANIILSAATSYSFNQYAVFSTGTKLYIESIGNHYDSYALNTIYKLRIVPGTATLYDGNDNVLSTFTRQTYDTNATTGQLFRIGVKYGEVRMHSFSIDSIMDLIPFRVGTTGYMYDRVSGQLFGNSGTGDFVLGPDKT